MDLNLTVKQSQTLSPQMVQSMKILQMGSQELLEYVQEILQENPVLEPPESGGFNEDISLLKKKLDWLDAIDRQERYYRQEDSENENDPIVNYGGVENQEENLYYYLLTQLWALDLPDDLVEATKAIVESLNGSGYLDETLEELAAAFRMEKKCMEQALCIVQSLEPAGVGARNLKECLVLQLERQSGNDELAKKIIDGYLDSVAKGRYHLISKELMVSEEAVRDACEHIRGLNPKPGAGFSAREQVHYITPDLFVEEYSDHYELATNDYVFPSLKISSYYRNLMDETQDSEVREYLSDKVRQAKWMVKSIEQRRSTLVNCAEHILEVQEDFFRYGRGHLVPMGLSDVAVKLGVHESTVSRAVKDKYIQCSHGVYPLSYFFSRSLGGVAENGRTVSADGAKALLKKLVEAENKKKPLSDQKLCELMEKQGFEISRRTVAKYRDELGILSTTLRKEHE